MAEWDLDDPAFEAVAPLGTGATVERFRALWTTAARSPSLGRVAEAHHDAIAILTEAGRAVDQLGLYAVWAAGGPDPLRLERSGERWQLRGSKHWCSGATFVSRALVTAQLDDGTGALVLIDLDQEGVRPAAANWESPAMASVDTRSVAFDLEIEADDIVGVDDWYLQRPGFWHGAVGVAACWAGCVDGIVQRLEPVWKQDSHAAAHLGAIDAILWNLRLTLDGAAKEIDCGSAASADERQQLALRARHIVDVGVGEIITRITRALGPGPLAHTPDLHRHLAETDIYRRQSHAERDLEVLGRLARP